MKRLLFLSIIALMIPLTVGLSTAQMYWEGEPEDAVVTENDLDVDSSVPDYKNTLLDSEIYDSFERMDVDPPSLNVDAQRPASVESGEEESAPARPAAVAPGSPIRSGFDRLPPARTTTPSRDTSTTAPRTTVTTTPRPAETSPGSTPAAQPTTSSGAGKSSPDVTTKTPAVEPTGAGSPDQPVTKRMQWGQQGATQKPADDTPKFQWGQPKSDQR